VHLPGRVWLKESQAYQSPENILAGVGIHEPRSARLLSENFPCSAVPFENRAMVMKRYQNGIAGEFFFMTTGSRGVHVYIPIQRSPLQKEV